MTDGAVDPQVYVASDPKIAWILKEPWEELSEGESGGGWSVSKDVATQPSTSNRGALATMSYITFAIFNGFAPYETLEYPTEQPKVGQSLRRIALVNIRKFPGRKTSNPALIASYAEKYRPILVKQIDKVLQPNVIIGGNVLQHFFSAWGLSAESFNHDLSAGFCLQDTRLYIHAYHPAHKAAAQPYVDDIVEIVRRHFPNPH